MLPGTRGDRVVVLDLLAADFVPGGALRVEVEGIKAVEVTNDASLTSGVKASTGELLNFIVLGVIEMVETITRLFVESDYTIVSGSKDMLTPGKSVGDG